MRGILFHQKKLFDSFVSNSFHDTSEPFLYL